MGAHARDQCIICGDQRKVTFVSWFIYKGTKGHFLCRQHEKEAVKVYKRSEINE